jgi:ribokinase
MRITVIGSINLDLVANAPRLPRAGETVTGATLARHPGGKGANQALAAQRLGAEVWMVGRVGRDGMAEEAMTLLLADGVDVAGAASGAGVGADAHPRAGRPGRQQRQDLRQAHQAAIDGGLRRH